MSVQLEESPRSSRVICSTVIFGSYLVVAAISALLVISLHMHPSLHAAVSLGVCVAAFAYIATAHVLLRRGRHMIAAGMLTSMYLLLAAGIVLSWGVNTPIGLLLFGLVIVLAGILLTASASIMAAATSVGILAGVQTAHMLDWHQPAQWAGYESTFGDVLGYGTIFAMLGLTSWLYNREMQGSLAHARQARAALLKQKRTLKERVKERTAELRQTQLNEMRQLYRFAELGQMGVTLLHDLANHLTVLTMELEGLQRTRHSAEIARAREITKYLEEIVVNTRSRLQGGIQRQRFDMTQKTTEVVTFLQYKAKQAEIDLQWHAPGEPVWYVGDLACFSQVVAIITNNAIDAYGDIPKQAFNPQKRRITVSLKRTKKHIIITIEDWGEGIPRSERPHIFKPFHSTKQSGLGIGLFIARQTVETNFGGTITLDPKSDHTVFTITLPRP